jgi:hypothetical protein
MRFEFLTAMTNSTYMQGYTVSHSRGHHNFHVTAHLLRPDQLVTGVWMFKEATKTQ